MTTEQTTQLTGFDEWADGFTADQYPFYSRGVPTSVSAPLRSQLRSAWQAATAAEKVRCAEIAKSFATCGCNGAYGRCNENDLPLAIHAAISKGSGE